MMGEGGLWLGSYDDVLGSVKEMGCTGTMGERERVS
jgi:hypothetical protein